MSFLFHRKTKRVLNVLWGIIAVMVIVGMVGFFAPGIVNLMMR